MHQSLCKYGKNIGNGTSIEIKVLQTWREHINIFKLITGKMPVSSTFLYSKAKVGINQY
jgi:hypothetical protein